MADDDVLTFEQLRNLQQQEREKDTLHDLDDRFFDLAKEYLERKQRIGDFKSNKEYRNARQIIEDIIDAREKKIIRLAFLSVTSGVSVDNLLAEEELLFDQVRQSIKEHRDELDAKLFEDDETGDTETEDTTASSEKTESDGTNDNSNDTDTATSTPDEERDASDDSDAATPEEQSVSSSEEAIDDAGENDDSVTEDDDGEEAGETVLFGGEDGDRAEAQDGTDATDDTAEDDMATVEIQEQVPEFMGVDMESYGPFEAGDEVAIPEENAEVLEEQGSAERIDT